MIRDAELEMSQMNWWFGSTEHVLGAESNLHSVIADLWRKLSRESHFECENEQVAIQFKTLPQVSTHVRFRNHQENKEGNTSCQDSNSSSF